MPRMALLGLAVAYVTSAVALGQEWPASGTAGAGVSEMVAGTAAPGMLDDPWSSPEIAPRMDARPLQRANPGAAVLTPKEAQSGEGHSWVRTTMALGAVVALIVLLGWGYRVVANGGQLRLPLRGRHPNLIEVLSRTNLSPRQSVCLVRIGPRMVLLGLTQDAVRALDVIDDADLTAQLAGEAARGRADSSTAAFAACLEEEAQPYRRAGHEDLDETTLPEEQQVLGIREKLAGTIEKLRATAG